MAGDDRAGKLVDGAILRLLLPAPKPRPAEPSPPARLVPPHRLVAPPFPLLRPRPDERLFIVRPTRPDWLPPPPPPPVTVVKLPPVEHRARNAGRHVAGNGNGGSGRGRGRGRIPRVFPPNGGRAGPERRKVAAPRKQETKAWVAVDRKGQGAGGEDQTVVSGGYSDGDEGDGDQLELDGNQESQKQGGSHRQRPDHECPHSSHGVQRPMESNQAPRLRGRMRMRQVECRNDIHTFTPGFLALYESLKPAEEHKTKQQQLVDSLTQSITKEWPNAQLHLYGSCANSFGSSRSDVDVCLQMDIGTGSTVEILLRLAEILQTGNFESVKAITGARVPIVTMSDPGSGFSCDICFNNLFAVANTKLLKDYAQIDQRLLQLAFLVKHWAKQRGVNETFRGTLSSYAYVIMCINFLQLRDPKILPCLQAMEPTYALDVDGTECAYCDEVHQLHDFSAENKESIAKLLWEFFHYWAFHHDYRNDVISVRLGKTITKQEKNWTTRIGNDRHLMCIEDPFETGHDLGRVVDRQTIKILREEFERAAAVLQYDNDPCVTLFEPYTL